MLNEKIRPPNQIYTMWWHYGERQQIISGVLISYCYMENYNILKDLKQYTSMTSQFPWGRVSWSICSAWNLGCELFWGSGSSFKLLSCWQYSFPCNYRSKALNFSGNSHSLLHALPHNMSVWFFKANRWVGLLFQNFMAFFFRTSIKGHTWI